MARIFIQTICCRWGSDLVDDGTEMKAYPAAAFIRFFQSHGLLSINDRPQWRTVTAAAANTSSG